MKLEVNAQTDDLLFMFVSAVRYGLGRQTYATYLIPKVIKANLALFNEKWVIVFLRDLIEYEHNRVAWEYKDDACDYESWMDLKRVLLELYKERGYTRPIN